jgi:DNA repair protein RadA/Sms
LRSNGRDTVKVKHIFVCQQCGKESAKWLGKCPDCGSWNSYTEKVVRNTRRPSTQLTTSTDELQELIHVKSSSVHRLQIAFSETNRVLGGGLVPGSLVLVGGEPGIGKSTLLVQIAALFAAQHEPVAYISGEESISQIKLRTERLQLNNRGLYVLTETNLPAVLDYMDKLSPKLLIIDSIQTMYLEEVVGVPGSINQIRETTLQLMNWVKSKNIPAFITGHVTKNGSIAGPNLLEHIVDVVLYLEGEVFSNYRILRSVKNRFGSTNEVGLFKMDHDGMTEVTNPSEVFLANYKSGTIGSAIVPLLEGNRPLLIEIQALTTQTTFSAPRRIANGIDFNRLLLISAVLTKRSGMKLYGQDIIVNVTGGLKIREPAVDLGVALAIASSFYDKKLLPNLVILGELGLNGELRTVPQIDRRIKEAARLGFTSCLLPKLPVNSQIADSNCQLLEANTLAEAIHIGMQRKVKSSNG